ncbi:MAG TPA: hypothetical protein VN699_12875 [Pirellulales bacterium]|nr:hypothetical protein [Pirellulales bacterium]
MLRSIAFMLGGALIGWRLASSPVKVGEDQVTPRPLPTSRQALVLAALENPCQCDFQERPLLDVVEFLAQRHKISIQLDHNALRDAGVDGDAPITCALEGVALRSALKLLLDEFDLTYVADDGFLLVTTKTEAENKLSFRIYPVADLVSTDSEFRSQLDPGGKDGNDYHSLIQLIASSLAPRSWDEVGGPGSLSAHNKSGALGVSQTDEVHEEIAALLANLRRVRDKQIAAARRLGCFRRRPPPDAAIDGEFEVRAYHFYFQPLMANAPGAPPAGDASAEANRAEAAKLAEARLDAWTKVIAKLVPQMIEPSSWEPAGDGRIRAASGTIMVRQTAEIQQQVGKLMYQTMLQGFSPVWYPMPSLRRNPSVRLSLPPGKLDWPQEAEPPLCGAEARIGAALEEDFDLDFAEQPLSDALDALAARHEIQMRIDRKAFQREGINADAPVTCMLRGVTLKAALKRLLDELELTYVIRNEVLLITTKTAADNLLIAKVYPVFDLVVRRPGGSPRTPALDFESLIEAITTNLEPTTWDEVGGPGAVNEFTNAGALVISQTAEIHDQIAAYLRALRAVAAAQK